MAKDKLRVLLVSPEVVPFAKTGGLADVAGALSKVLSRMGCEVKTILPKYKMVDEKKYGLENIDSFLPGIRIAEKEVKFKIKKCHLPDSNAEYLFLENKEFFDRDELYADKKTGQDYEDNDERFILFARGVLETIKALDWKPDLIHCNDWQSALIPAYLKTILEEEPFYKNIATLLTIHNIAYQGNFPRSTFDKLGLKKELFYPLSPFEYWGGVNFLKIGISYADLINTVSEKYAQEIQSGPEFGYGMEGILKDRTRDTYGVLNGADYEEWSPEKDKLIPYNYGKGNLQIKSKNKELLLRQAGLETDRNEPLIGMISRLADQKGFDLLHEIADKLLSLGVKLIILGTGEQKYHIFLSGLEKKYPDKAKIYLKYDNKLAHLIEAGADIFLMPSRYEPCGLNQMYSLRYGTVPIVRETGGLADTIQDYDTQNQKGTGFVFKDYNGDELLSAIKRALILFKDRTAWKNLMLQGMEKDFSWEASAKKYIQLYNKAVAKKRR
ncbi:MAG: glycogen synthase GlgA [candidate division Zixibacteria bacterium]|nr:glycogen synthase GlgA [candidate division Zixibacteria bacterium]